MTARQLLYHAAEFGVLVLLFVLFAILLPLAAPSPVVPR